MEPFEKIHKGTVEKLAYGGIGIVRHEGLVVFVPFTAPGDLISFKIIKTKKSYAEGVLIDLIESSPLRIVPKCPHFGVCGGCQLQHISYSAQRQHKHQVVAEALERIGGMPGFPVSPLVPTEDIWAYRRHISLNARFIEGKGYEIGYIAVDHATLLPITECPIFADHSEPLFLFLRELFSQLNGAPGSNGRGVLIKQENNSYLGYFSFSSLPANIESVFKEAMAISSFFKGAIVAGPEKTCEFGDSSAHLTVEGLSIQFSPKSFIQNHPGQSAAIYRELVRIAELHTAKRVLDLYCGIGISSLLLTRIGCEVTGVENNKEAVSHARDNAAKNNLGPVRFMEADVGNVLPKLLTDQKPDLIIVNPPRMGLDPKVVKALVSQKPKIVVYISCKPSTLARDLRLLCEKTYRLASCQPYDMFPQTGHVETMAILETV